MHPFTPFTCYFSSIFLVFFFGGGGIKVGTPPFGHPHKNFDTPPSPFEKKKKKSKCKMQILGRTVWPATVCQTERERERERGGTFAHIPNQQRTLYKKKLLTELRCRNFANTYMLTKSAPKRAKKKKRVFSVYTLSS